MPAPAVIPAPRAYINAVAVKGFVVELWNVKPRPTLFPRSRETSIIFRERQKLRSRERFLQMAANYASNARRRTSVFITVTKEVRPKQSIDMN